MRGLEELRFRAKGFTLVEGAISVLIAIIVLAMGWRFFVLDQRRSHTDNSRLSGLQGALEFDEALALDLDRVAVSSAETGGIYSVVQPVNITAGARRLDFRIFGTETSGSVRAPINRVEYSLDPLTGRVMRWQDADSKSFPGLQAEDLQFTRVLVSLTPPTLTSPGDFTFGRDDRVQLLKYVLTCLAEGSGGRASLNARPEDVVTLVGNVALVIRSERVFHPCWRAGVGELMLE